MALIKVMSIECWLFAAVYFDFNDLFLYITQDPVLNFGPLVCVNNSLFKDYSSNNISLVNGANYKIQCLPCSSTVICITAVRQKTLSLIFLLV